MSQSQVQPSSTRRVGGSCVIRLVKTVTRQKICSHCGEKIHFLVGPRTEIQCFASFVDILPKQYTIYTVYP